MDEGPRSPGYWVSEDDSIATIERLREWGEVTATTVASAGDTQEWLRTELAVRLHALLQLRSGEAAGLFARDLVLTEDRICAFVRPRPKRSLKTASSKRWVSTNIAPATSARISVLIESLQESRVPGELLATASDPSIRAVGRRIGSLHYASAQAATKGRMAHRIHGYRHSYATSVGVALTPASGATIVPLPVSRMPRSDAVGALPARVEYAYHSRQLGHGSPVTSLTWYDHSVALQLPIHSTTQALPYAIEAHLFNQPPHAYRKAVQRSRGRPAWGRYVDHQWHAQLAPTSARPAYSAPPTIQREPVGWITMAARVAIELRMGRSMDAISQKLGIRRDLCDSLSDQIRHLDQLHKVRYVDRDAETDRAHRTPKARRYLYLALEADSLIRLGKVSAGDLYRDAEQYLSRGASDGNSLARVMARTGSGTAPPHVRRWLALAILTGTFLSESHLMPSRSGSGHARASTP